MTRGVGEYLSGNRLLSFPFADGQPHPGISEEMLEAIFSCFADALICVPPHVAPYVANITSDGVTLRFDIVVGEARVALSVARSASVLFPIASGRTDWGSYVVTLSSEGIRNLGEIPGVIFPAPEGPSSPEGAGFRFSPKCVVEVPGALNSIMVYDGVRPKSEGPHFIMKGDIAFMPGNNFTFTQADRSDGFELNAVPGAGKGVVPCGCEDDFDPTQSQLYSEDGHPRIFNDTCYDTVPSTEDGTFVMNAKCTACCTCKMYEEIVNNRLVSLFGMVKESKRGIEDNLEKYEEAVELFNNRIREPLENDVKVTISGAPQATKLGSRLSDGGDVKGYMNRASFVATARNNSFFNIHFTITDVEVSGASLYECIVTWTNEDRKQQTKTVTGVPEGEFVVAPGYALLVTFIGVKEDLVGSPKTDIGYTGRIIIKAEYDDPESSGGLILLSVYTREVSV